MYYHSKKINFIILHILHVHTYNSSMLFACSQKPFALSEYYWQKKNIKQVEALLYFTFHRKRVAGLLAVSQHNVEEMINSNSNNFTENGNT